MSTLDSSVSVATQRSQTASLEVCSVSPQLRLRGDPTLDFNQSDGRVRTSSGSSNDLDSIQEDGFLLEAFRSGGPCICETPVATLPIPRALKPENAHDAYRMVLQILEDGGITEEGLILLFCMRHPVDDESQQIPTLYIQATKNRFDRSWLELSRSVHQCLRDMGISFSVEIADSRAFEPIQFLPVRPDDAVYSCWPDVCRSILAFCHPYEVNTVGCFRIGRSTNWEENSPTIFMTVDPNTESDWKNVRELILDILQMNGLPTVGIRIQKDYVSRFAGDSQPAMPRSVLKPAVQVGQSLGVRDKDDTYGTFGGMIELQKSTGEWVKYGITCRHCVLDEDAPQSIQMEQHEVDTPSLKDLGEEIRQRTELINEIQSEESYIHIQKLLQDPDPYVPKWEERNFKSDESLVLKATQERTEIEDFRGANCHHLGHVFMTTDKRTCNATTVNSELETILDWALIAVSDARIGTNDIFTYGLMQSPSRFNREIKALENPVPRAPYNGMPLFKVGRSTGFTEGMYSDLKTAHLEKEIVNGEQQVKATMEHTATGRGETFFSRPGDSGAFVMNRNGSVVGLLFGGNKKSPVSYFTHWDDLAKSILEVTGAVDARVMQ